MPEFQYAPPRRPNQSDEDNYIPSESFARRSLDGESRPRADEPDFNPFDDEDESDTAKKHRDLFPQSEEEAAAGEMDDSQVEETEDSPRNFLAPEPTRPAAKPSFLDLLLKWVAGIFQSIRQRLANYRSKPKQKKIVNRVDYRSPKNRDKDRRNPPPKQRSGRPAAQGPQNAGPQGGEGGPKKRRRKGKPQNQQGQETQPRQPNRVSEPNRVSGPNRVTEPTRVTETNRLTEPNRVTETNRLTEPNRVTETNRLTEPNRSAEAPTSQDSVSNRNAGSQDSPGKSPNRNRRRRNRSRGRPGGSEQASE